jgi:hypothetical protein
MPYSNVRVVKLAVSVKTMARRRKRPFAWRLSSSAQWSAPARARRSR